MGAMYEAVCKRCGKKFELWDGGGFIHHRLRCDQCGEDKAIAFDEIGEPHLRYIKGLAVPYSTVTREADQAIQENYPGEPMGESEYHGIVEDLCGKCACGGQFRFDAPPRCPKCRSTDIEYDSRSPSLHYD